MKRAQVAIENIERIAKVAPDWEKIVIVTESEEQHSQILSELQSRLSK